LHYFLAGFDLGRHTYEEQLSVLHGKNCSSVAPETFSNLPLDVIYTSWDAQIGVVKNQLEALLEFAAAGHWENLHQGRNALLKSLGYTSQ
jgi:hypothetical protein